MARNYDFKVIEYADLETFETEVVKRLEEGWELHGAMIAFPNPSGKDGEQSIRYIQAMKKENRPEGGVGFRWAT